MGIPLGVLTRRIDRKRARALHIALALSGCAVLSLTFSPAAAQPLDTPYLVRDIANGEPDPEVGSNIHLEGSVGGRGLFWVQSQVPGGRWTLWSTDGTESGSIEVSDLMMVSGGGDPNFRLLCSDDSRALYVDGDLQSGFVLWSTNGTLAGTAALSSLPSRSATAMLRRARSCDDLTVSGSTLFWTQQYQGLQPPTYDLWSTGAAHEGFRLVKHLGRDSEEYAAGVSDWARLGDTIVFSLRTAPNGYELWRTDGTATGTVPFLSTLQGVPQLDARGFAVVGEAAFFVVNGTEFSSLAVTDGTASGTRVFPDLSLEYSNPPGVRAGVALATRLVFAAWSSSLGTSQLWGVGPEASTLQALTDFADVEGLQRLAEAPIGGHAVFAAKFRDPEGREFAQLLLTDGTVAGTEVVDAVCAGTEECRIDALGETEAAAYFAAVRASEVELWRTDGTVAGTVLLRMFDCEVTCEMATLGSTTAKLYLILGGRSPGETQSLWVTDGSPLGTREIVPAGTVDLSQSLYLGRIALSDDQLIFGATDVEAGLGLWITDGTAAGSHRLTALARQPDDSSPSHLEGDGSRVLFSARTLGAGAEPWISDGTAFGTSLVVDARPGPFDSFAQPLSATGGVWPLALTTEDGGSATDLYATTGEPGNLTWIGPAPSATSISFAHSTLIATNLELWRFDANPPHIEPVAEIYAGLFLPLFLATGTRGAYFRKHAAGQEDLWITDGTEQGTRLLCEAPPFYGQDATQWIGELGTRVLFRANSPDGKTRLYSCREGEVAELLSGVLDGTDNSSPDGFVRAGDWSLFAATDFTGDRELWRTKGTLLSTGRLANLSISDSSSPGDFVAVEGGVIFSAADDTHGRELWFSDGTASGTRMVADIASGPMSSNPSGFESIGGKLVFAAETLARGRELWVTEGTPESTAPLPEIRPGPLSSWPAELTAAQHRLFLRAADERGAELWALCPSWVAGSAEACNELFADGFEDGSVATWSASTP